MASTAPAKDDIEMAGADDYIPSQTMVRNKDSKR